MTGVLIWIAAMILLGVPGLAICRIGSEADRQSEMMFQRMMAARQQEDKNV